MPLLHEPRRRRAALLGAVLGIGALVLHAEGDHGWTTGVDWPEPKVVEPGPPGLSARLSAPYRRSVRN